MKQIFTIQTIARTVLALWCLGQTTAATAAMLDLSDAPLFLTLKSAPNILFVVDDSGSMDYEVMTRDVVNEGRFASTQPDGSNPPGAGSVKHRDDNDDGVPDCSFAKNGQTFNGYIYGVKFPNNSYGGGGGQNCNIVDDQEWRFRNSDFNPLYFNPNRTYKPWLGVDDNGVPFKDMPITAAKDDPYDPNSPTVDLTRHNSKRGTSDRDGDGQPDGFRYYTWTDLDGDGLFDNGEQTAHLIKNADPATQQNFANWFSYHRTREYVTKAAYGEVLAEAPSNVRMGLVTLQNNAGSNTAIASMNSDPTTGHKRALLDSLYKIRSAGHTPLRSSLDSAGKYLECVSGSGLFSSCPALSETEGGACQQNFVILMTDGFYNDSVPNFGNTDGPGSGNTEWDGGAYADNYSNTLADVAMHYYERDLHPGLSNNVPVTPGVDEASHQHMVTYAVAFGVNGTLTSNPPNPTDPFAWPNPANGNPPKIDDLRHAAYNGRGEFLSAAKPEELITALKGAVNSIAERTSSAASVALNSGSHNANSRVYQARFTSGAWSGELLSFLIDDKGAILSPEWDTGDVLDTQDWDTGRTILTYDDDATVPTGIAFRWNSLSTAMQNLLHLNADGVNDGEGEARLDYLRGNRADEGTGNNYRVRKQVLGDLLNSDPFFVGAPSFPDTLGAGYKDFRGSYSGRLPMVYVGGNDGMLHGFAATDGTEKLAYVPNVVFRNLSQLTDPAYNHRYFVDGSPTVGDAYGNFGNRCGAGASCWRSVLVSGLRKGGQGVFALDVTDPSTFNESNAAKLALWEFTDEDDADLGYSFNQPSIVKMANGQWAAVFGNGYNNSEADGRASTSGHAVLYIVFLDKGLDGTWALGTDYIKLDTGVGETGTPNSLATPAPVDFDGDFDVEYIYAGDLRGNLWKFDVSDTNPSNWGAPVLLFTAPTVNGIPQQPITSRLEVGRHPLDQNGTIIYFGTGKYLEPSDSTTSIPTQTFYAVWDEQATSPTPLTRSNLLAQTVVAVVSDRRITSNNPIDWDVHHGWYLDLPVAGERQISDSVLRNSRIIFTTLIPNVEICNFGGTTWLMEIDAFSGSRLLESPFDLNDDGKFDDNDLVQITINGIDEKVAISGLQSTQGILPTPTVLASGDTEIKYNSGSAGGIFVTTENPGATAHGRQAWRQLQ